MSHSNRTTAQPLLVTFNWSEQQPDRSVIPRSHTQMVEHMPFKYTINVGLYYPVMESLSIKLKNAQAQGKEGYSDGKDPGGAKFVPKWIDHGENVAIGKTYALSEPSLTNRGAGDDLGRKLTTGAGGPSYGAPSYASGALWKENANPIITLDLEKVTQCASFGLNFHGYPWWDALKGQVKDSVQVLTSIDGKNYESQVF